MIYENLPAETYYADEIAGFHGPSLTQSTANKLLQYSPLHAWRDHPLLGNNSREPTPQMEFGTLAHAMLLEPDSLAGYVILDYSDWRTKAAQSDRDAAEAAGKTAILRKDVQRTEKAAASVREKLAGWGIELTGQSEVTVTWEEQSAYGPVKCRSRIDHLIGGFIIDIKTCTDARPSVLPRHYIEYGYDVQAAAYSRALQANGIEVNSFINVFIETQEPHITVPAFPSAEMIARGERRWLQAVEKWAECLHTNNWPAYSTGPVTIDPPKWAKE